MIERKTIAITQLIIADEDVTLDTVQGVNYDVKNSSTESIKLTLNGTDHTLETGVVAVVVDGEIAHFIGGELSTIRLKAGVVKTDNITSNQNNHIYFSGRGVNGIDRLDAISVYTPNVYATTLRGALAASYITSGVLNASRIPNLSASKITSGTLSLSRLPWEITGKKVWGAVAN